MQQAVRLSATLLAAAISSRRVRRAVTESSLLFCRFGRFGQSSARLPELGQR